MLADKWNYLSQKPRLYNFRDYIHSFVHHNPLSRKLKLVTSGKVSIKSEENIFFFIFSINVRDNTVIILDVFPHVISIIIKFNIFYRLKRNWRSWRSQNLTKDTQLDINPGCLDTALLPRCMRLTDHKDEVDQSEPTAAYYLLFIIGWPL